MNDVKLPILKPGELIKALEALVVMQDLTLNFLPAESCSYAARKGEILAIFLLIVFAAFHKSTAR